MRPRELYLIIQGMQSLVRTEQESRASTELSFSRRVWLWRHGFLSRSDILYELEPATLSEYVSDYQRFVKTRQINGTWSFALKNKLMFHWLMAPHDRNRMTVHGILRNGNFHSLDRAPVPNLAAPNGSIPDTAFSSLHSGCHRDVDVILDRLDAVDRLVLKWIHGGGGNNVLVCERQDDGIVVNGDRHTRSSFRQCLTDLQNYLVCEFVSQASYATKLFPDAPNTIRILTMYDETEGEAYVPAAIHRIGTRRSVPMDNFLQGGLSAPITLDTGTLGSAAQLPYDGSLTWHDHHPDTKAPIAGSTIPEWKTILADIQELASLHPYLPYVGWDVIVTDADAGFTIIEANSYPGLHSIQVHAPLLRDDRARTFYRRHNVVS